MAAPRTQRHVILLSDVDGTLISEKKKSAFKPEIAWHGGSNTFWQNEIKHFKDTARQAGVVVHFGIASGKFSDLNSRIVCEDPKLFSESMYTPFKLKAGCGLKSLLEEEKDILAFDSSIEHRPGSVENTNKIAALEAARERIIGQFRAQGLEIKIEKKDMSLLDNTEGICTAVNAEGLTAICVAELARTTDVGKQRELIHGYLEKLANVFGFVLGPTPVMAEGPAPKKEATGAGGGPSELGAFGRREERKENAGEAEPRAEAGPGGAGADGGGGAGTPTPPPSKR